MLFMCEATELSYHQALLASGYHNRYDAVYIVPTARFKERHSHCSPLARFKNELLRLNMPAVIHKIRESLVDDNKHQ